MLKNNNLYNDKELFDDGDLNWYDYGFRNYDPQIGRFAQLDPLTDETPTLSGYHYALNDPIGNIDEDGLAGVGIIGQLACWGGQSASMASMMSTLSAVGNVVGIAANILNIGSNVAGIVNNATLNSQINGQVSTQGVGDPGDKYSLKQQKQKANDYDSWSSFDKGYYEVFGRKPQYYNSQSDDAPWMIKAASQLGKKETTGNNDGPDVERYLKTVGLKPGPESAWCAAFVNWVLTGSNTKGTGDARAYSYDTYGMKLSKPAYGAIVVMKYSHVAFLAGINSDGRLILLGGNQGNPGSVNLSPNLLRDVKSFRYPSGFTPNYNLPRYNLTGRSLDFSSSH